MCGITGVFSTEGISENGIRRATEVLSHRGPNAQGVYFDEQAPVCLGHRRLSILDLSEVANQPMHSACRGYVIVYNGEVYNFNSLRNKLPGFLWKTSSDTEVILELFAAFGNDCFSWLNGMFSIAIYNIRARKLIIARDQIGIKPLFYHQHQDGIIFASELKAIKAYLQTQSKNLKINRSAVPSFLHLGFIPEPETIYQQTFKFPAGHHGTISEENPVLTLHKYWDASEFFLTEPISNEQFALKKYKDLLFSSVNDQMVSDVPLGTFLSGGIDSSLVTAAAVELAPQKVNTFSIGFHEAEYDESEHALAVAKHLKTEHHTFKVNVDEVLDLVPQLLDVYDEPFADSSAFPTMLVSRLAKQHVTVTLSGDGGDELFQGYGMYTWANRLDNPLISLGRKPLYYASKGLPDRYQRAGRIFNYPDRSRIPTHIFSQEQYYFSEQELSSLLISPNFDFGAINGIPARTNDTTAADVQAFWDLEHYLKDDLLVKVDRAAMAYSLETRVPLLDKRLVEFALNLHSTLKVKADYGSKYLMKKTLYELVPRKLFERPKRGFAIPLMQWLQGPLSWMIDDYLAERIIEKHAVVHHSAVKHLIQKFRAGHQHLYNRIWVLIILHWWLEKNHSENQ